MTFRRQLTLATAILLAAVSVLLGYAVLVSGPEEALKRFESGSQTSFSRFYQMLVSDSSAGVKVLGSSLRELELVDSPRRCVLVILGSSREPTGLELDALRSFVERGGKVLIADDFGFGSVLVDAVSPADATVKFSGLQVYQQQFSRNRSFPVVTVPAGTFGGQQTQVVLAVPGSLRVSGTEATVMLRSEEDGYLAKPGRSSEPLENGSQALLATWKHGSGTVAAFSCPAMFQDQFLVLSEFGNPQFALALIGWLGGQHSVRILDSSLVASRSLTARAWDIVRSPTFVGICCAVASVPAVQWAADRFASRRAIGTRSTTSPDEPLQ